MAVCFRKRHDQPNPCPEIHRGDENVVRCCWTRHMQSLWTKFARRVRPRSMPPEVRGGVSVLVAVLLLSSATLWAGFEDLARSGDWERVIEVASRRIDQVPLSPEEAMIAAYAARALGDRGAEQQFLEIAADVAGGELLALSLIHISEPTRQPATSRMPSSA